MNIIRGRQLAREVINPFNFRASGKLYTETTKLSTNVKLLTILFICVSICSNAQVRTSYYGGDTLKGSIKKMTEDAYIYSWERSIKVVYTCDVPQGTEMAVFCDTDNRLCDKWLVKYDKGHVIEEGLYYNDGTLCQVKNYKYDKHGRVIEERSVDSNCQKCNALTDYLSGTISNWATGTASSGRSRKYEYDNAGHIVRMEIKYFSSTSADTTADITDYKYDGKGNKVEQDLLRRGFAWVKNWYSDGREITEKTLYRYDVSNNLVEDKAYFVPTEDRTSKPHTGTMVGAGSEYTYDDLSNMTSRSFYHLYRQEDGSETREVYSMQHKEGKGEPHAEAQKEYDKQGNVIKITLDAIVILRREIEYF